jgi:hypothetical protein
MHFFLVFMLLFFSLGVLTAPSAVKDLIVVPDTSAIGKQTDDKNMIVRDNDASGQVELSVLQLPADFDMSHPALDIKSQLDLLENDPSASLPQLPASIQALAKKISIRDVNAMGGAIIHCAFGSAQPNYKDGLIIGEKLKALTSSWCCQTKVGISPPCTPMQASGNAAVAICSPPKRCVPCSYVGQTVKNHVTACKKGDTSGGFSSYVYPPPRS